MRLFHIHLPKPIPYAHSLKLQEALVEKHFAHKALVRKDASLATRPPAPTLLTFQTQPTYTVGRRHLNANPLSQSQISFLTGAARAFPSSADDDDLATFFPSPRGGLLTYHAPGQLTAYLILNLRTHGLTPRCYIRMLENIVIRTCARHGVANTLTTDDPGVWVGEPVQATVQDSSTSSASGNTKHEPVGEELCTLSNRNENLTLPGKQNLRPTNRKICAIGVHVSRGITSHGIGLNVFDAPVDNASPLRAFYTLPQGNVYTSIGPGRSQFNASGRSMQDSDILATGYLSWGFSRIIACGLEGKSVTWLAREQSVDSKGIDRTLSLESVAESLAEEVAQSLMIKKESIERLTAGSTLEYQTAVC